MGARVRVVLQSRLSSSRLPGKAMLSVAGRPMVVLAAQRAGNAGHDVVVATSDRAEDDVIASACADAGVAVVRGPLDDPLARFVIATKDLADEDVVVRLTADNVVPDGALVDFLVTALAGRGYARFGGDDPLLPYGVAGEAFSVAALRDADARATEASDREHVTPMIRATHGDRRLDVPALEPAWAGLRCTVDTFDDFVRIARVFGSVADPMTTPWRALCDEVAARGTVTPLPVRRENPIGQAALVLGTVQLGLAYGAANSAGMPSAADAADVLAAARDAGVTHLDTARAYGESEARIGHALARGLSEHVGIVTKVAPLADGDGADAVRASVEKSLRLLGASALDALLLHRAADWTRPGVVDALGEYPARLVGASLSTPDELVALLADPRCGYVQLPFNVLDRRWLAPEVQDALAARPDVVVTVRSAYLQGLLVSGEARWPANAGLDPVEVLASLDAAVSELGRASRADLCTSYVLGHAWVTSVVAGAETPGQVRENAMLVRNTPLHPDEIARVHELLPAGPADLVDPSRWRNA
ncbi:MAG: aldo/keto reductase [Nocardioidaceae bacterium]|nr:aldo/keto reductase [Nocardioidaceae bacterium]